MLRIAILGATGRMGQALLRLTAAAADLECRGAATEPGHALLGQDVHTSLALSPAGVELTDDPATALADVDVAIDFTLPAAAAGNLAACRAAGVPVVLGTTGLTSEGEAALASASAVIPVLYGRNMSLGVNLLTELVRLASETLGTDYDIEIIEAHHRHKVDAPSGTALQLGEAAAAARGQVLDEVAIHARHGHTGERPPGAIGFNSVRAGSLAGDHRVLLAADEEVLELGHHAVNRDVFARGALQAARWLVAQSPGLYSMRDVLGLAPQ
jgi:4-hydroxy-tetrahydrodipicolinate reductase